MSERLRIKSKRLVYGILNDNLVILPEQLALAVANDLSAIWGLETYGAARRFRPRFLMVPGLLEDEDEPLDDDHPYDAAETNECQDGNWPPTAATLALDYLPDDLDDIGEQKDRFPGFPILYIDPITEVDLVEALRQRGYDVRRDDRLMERIGTQ